MNNRYEMFVGVDYERVDVDQLGLMVDGCELASGIDLAEAAMVEYENEDRNITAHALLVQAIVALHVQRELNEFPGWTNIKRIQTGPNCGAVVEFENSHTAMIFKLRKA